LYTAWLRNLDVLIEILLYIFFSMQGGGEGRRTRPQDLTRLYEIILQNYGELQQLPGLEDDLQYQQEIETKTKAYRAFRYSSRICFHLYVGVTRLCFFPLLLVHGTPSPSTESLYATIFVLPFNFLT
jgi:hypothetical protein